MQRIGMNRKCRQDKITLFSPNAYQQDLLTMAQTAGKATQAKVCVFSHFTFFNYDYDIPFDNTPRSLPIEDDAFNKVNVGTCEQNREWFFKECINQGIHYHFSGHSHRAGVYVANTSNNQVTVTTALDPAFQNYTAAANKTTFIVSSSGGPIGVQNFDGFGITRPSSGTIVDTLTGKILQLKTLKDGKPRLCVLLDYLHLLQGHKFMDKGVLLGDTFQFSISPVIIKLDCIESISFWMFEESKDEVSREAVLGWKKITTDNLLIHKGKNMGMVSLNEEIIARYRSNQEDQKLICHVALKEINHPWGIDIDHESPWLFPVKLRFDFEEDKLSISRPEGELGEVPDWEWLAKNFKDKYPSPNVILKK